MSLPRVVGLDLSLTSTGIATVWEGPLTTETRGSKGKADATLAARYLRLSALVDQVMYLVAPGSERPDLVVIEGPSFSSVGSGTHDRSGFWWLTMHRLFDLGLTVLEVPPSCRTKYATGKGNVGKQDVVIAVTRRYPEVVFHTNDEADALILAAIGRRLLGEPIEESLPQTHLDSLKTLRLPEAA